MSSETRCEVLEGDALTVLPTLHGQADAIVTSPPYADQRSYDDTTKITIDGYAEWLRPFLAAMLPCVGPDGSLMLNVGRLHRAGLERGIAEDARRAAPPGGTVLDPFCGSGTTGVAALERGRGFLGVEAHPPYAAEARRRLMTTTPSLGLEAA